MTKTLFFGKLCVSIFLLHSLFSSKQRTGGTRQIASTGQPQAWTMWKKQTPPLVDSLVPPIRQLGDHNHYRNPNGPTQSQVKIFLMKKKLLVLIPQSYM